MSAAVQDPSVSLSLSLSVVNYLLTIAADRPFKESAGVIQALRTQAEQALKPLPGIPDDE